MTIILLLAGLGLIVLGADWLVDGASAIARKAGVSEFVIGLTIVGSFPAVNAAFAAGICPKQQQQATDNENTCIDKAHSPERQRGNDGRTSENKKDVEHVRTEDIPQSKLILVPGCGHNAGCKFRKRGAAGKESYCDELVRKVETVRHSPPTARRPSSPSTAHNSTCRKPRLEWVIRRQQ